MFPLKLLLDGAFPPLELRLAHPASAFAAWLAVAVAWVASASAGAVAGAEAKIPQRRPAFGRAEAAAAGFAAWKTAGAEGGCRKGRKFGGAFVSLEFCPDIEGHLSSERSVKEGKQ